MAKEKYILVPKLARLLGVSRIAICDWVKKWLIPAIEISKTYAI